METFKIREEKKMIFMHIAPMHSLSLVVDAFFKLICAFAVVYQIGKGNWNASGPKSVVK